VTDLPGTAAGKRVPMPRTPPCRADHTAIFCRFADALASLIAARLRAIQRRSA